jgi:hypothetical protein
MPNKCIVEIKKNYFCALEKTSESLIIKLKSIIWKVYYTLSL